MAKLSVHLIAWNGAKYIPYLFESLRRQTYKDWELLAIDNGSKDGTADLIEKELGDFTVSARLIRNEKNLGFAGGHNQAVRLSLGRAQGLALGEYFQLLNQDMYLAPDYLEKVVAMMDGHPEAGAGQGMLLRWEFNKMTNDELRMTNEIGGLTDIVDTMGLKVMRNRRVVDWRTGEQVRHPERSEGSLTNVGDRADKLRDSSASPQNDENVVEVFGVSGALPVYRRQAIERVMYEGKMFDEDFFMYKEDVDLAFRLRAAGWKAYVVTDARAWHDRTAAGPRQMADRATLQNRRTKSAFINYHSYKNHLLVLLKNEHRANFAKDWSAILWYELKKFVYLLSTDWGTLKGLREVCKLWKRTMEKRKFIMGHYQVKPQEMREWFV